MPLVTAMTASLTCLFCGVGFLLKPQALAKPSGGRVGAYLESLVDVHIEMTGAAWNLFPPLRFDAKG